MSKKFSGTDNLPPSMQRNLGGILGLGILFIILGTIGLGTVVGLTIAGVLFLSILLFIAGISQIIDVFKSREWEGALWHLIIAVLYLIAGGIIAYDPFLASTAITALIAWVLIIIGTARLIMAFSLRHATGWGWFVLSGIAAIVLGVLIIMQWPVSGLWVIGMLIAVELIISGWTYVFLALALRRR